MENKTKRNFGKKPIFKWLVNFFFCLLLIISAGILLPTTPRARQSLLTAISAKDSLLQFTPAPRMILTGGSALSFGFNSEIIVQKTGLNVVNTGIHASVGLIFMLQNTLKYLKKGDIVVIVPEYHQFFGDYAYGEMGDELARIIFDAKPQSFQFIEGKQYFYVLKKLPFYAVSKLNPAEYFFSKKIQNGVYSRSSFNHFGDAVRHRNLPKAFFLPFVAPQKPYNQSVMKKLKDFAMLAEKKGAKCFITFPPYQDASFQNGKEKIHFLSEELKKNRLNIIGIPEDFVAPDSLFFNSPYHLSGAGIERNTHIFLQKFRETDVFRLKNK